MKLLNKSFKPFSIFIVIIVFLSIPAYYYVIQLIYLNDADDSLRIRKEKIQDSLQKLSDENEDIDDVINQLNRVALGIQIKPLEEKHSIKNDSIYTVTRFDKYHGHDEPFRILNSSIMIDETSYFIQIEVDLDEFNDVVPYTASVTGLFFMLILLAYYLVNRRIEKQTWRPFFETLQKLEEYSISSEQSFPELESDVEEFNQLKQILEKFTNFNRKQFNKQKEFTENAAHELQTPLMIMQAKADAMMQLPSITKEQIEKLEEMKQILSRIAKINKNLLLLTKIENQQYEKTSLINICDLANAEISFFEELIKHKNIDLEVDFSSDKFVEANEVLVQSLINNLLTNAITYTRSKGKIQLKITDKILMISNSASGEALDKEKVFERFYKQSSIENSNGLGLSIVHQVCSYYNWQVDYNFIENKHFFTVKW